MVEVQDDTGEEREHTKFAGQDAGQNLPSTE